MIRDTIQTKRVGDNMSNRERIIQLIENVPEHKLTFEEQVKIINIENIDNRGDVYKRY